MPIPTTPPRAALAAMLLTASLTACGSDPTGPRPPAQVRVTDGDGQIARIGTVLPAPIVATVLDADGQPAKGVQVEWLAERRPARSRSARRPTRTVEARAQWQLGQSEGRRRGQASLPGLEPAVFTAIAEGPDALPFDELTPLDFATYDGSRQVVHPDYVATPAGAFGLPFHLAITPYPFGNAAFENPSFFEATRRDAWTLSPANAQSGRAAGRRVSVRPRPGVRAGDGRAVAVLPPGDHRQHRAAGAHPRRRALVRARSRWSGRPTTRSSRPASSAGREDDWWMFAVNAGVVGLRRGGDHGGGAPLGRRAAVGRSGGGRTSASRTLWPWHIDVQWIPSRERVLGASTTPRPATGCTTPAVYLAESADGSPGSRCPSRCWSRASSPTFQDIVYRTTFEYDPLTDAITFWFSGARFDGSQVRLGRGGRAPPPGCGVRAPSPRRSTPRSLAPGARSAGRLAVVDSPA